MAVADAREPILIPAVRFGPGMIVRQVLPGIAVGAVIFPDGAQARSLGRAPSLPMGCSVAGFFESALFGGHWE